MALDLVLFDLDGTLLDTAPEIADATNDTLQAMDLRGVDDASVRQWIGHGAMQLLAKALGQGWGVTPDAAIQDRRWAEAQAIFRQAYQRRCGTRSTFYDGVQDTLHGLAHQGVPMAVVTNKEADFAHRVLQAHGLTDTFAAMVGGDTLPTKKPDPSGVQQLMRQHQARAGYTVFVGDSVVDAQTARAAGIACWLVPYGYNAGMDVRQAGADRVVANLTALLPLAETAGAPLLLGPEQ